MEEEERREEIQENYSQLAPILLNLYPKICEIFPSWSTSIENQEMICKWLKYDPHLFFHPSASSSSSSSLPSSSCSSIAKYEFLPPLLYRKTLYKLFIKAIEEANEEFSDELMKEYLQTMNTPLEDPDNEIIQHNNGYISYTTPYLTPYRIPFFIRRAHNEVGMKVWNAGLFLIEIFYSLIQQSIEQYYTESCCLASKEDDEDCSPSLEYVGTKKEIYFIEKMVNLWFSDDFEYQGEKRKVFMELGAGIGMSSIMIQRGLLLPLLTALQCKAQLKKKRPIAALFPKFYLTDYNEEIIQSTEQNIHLSEALPSNSTHFLKWSSRLPFPPSKDEGKEENQQALEKGIARNLIEQQKEQKCLEGMILNWKNYSSEILHAQPIHCLFAADCTYSEDLNLSIVEVFEDYLTNNILARDILHINHHRTSFEKNEWLLIKLLERRIPFVLIACTVRNPDTYQHFLQCVNSKQSLQFIDLSLIMKDIQRKYPYLPGFIYESYGADLRLLCITHTSLLFR